MSATQSKEKIRNGKTSAYYGRQRGGYMHTDEFHGLSIKTRSLNGTRII